MISGRLSAALAVVAGSFGTITSLMKAGQFEQTKIAFETMLGSAEETKKTLADLTEFAALTPFEMPEILQAARGLIQFGERGKDLIETMEMLGNAASGTSTPFGFLALVFNQVRGVGKLLTQDFRQLSTRGILSLQDIADHFDVTTSAAQEMISTGRVSFEDLKDIFRELSEEGGRFHNLMEKQSTSLLGLWSTFKDVLGITSRVIGDMLMPAAKRFEVNAIRIAENVRVWIGENKELITTFVNLAVNVAKYGIALMSAAAAVKILSIAVGVYNALGKTTVAIQTLILALSGPKGWAQMAIGIAAAAGSLYAMNSLLGDTVEEVRDARVVIAEMADGTNDVKEGLASVTDAAKEAAQAMGEMKLERIKESVFHEWVEVIQEIQKETENWVRGVKNAELGLFEEGPDIELGGEGFEKLPLGKAIAKLNRLQLMQQFGSEEEMQMMKKEATRKGWEETFRDHRRQLIALRAYGEITGVQLREALTKAFEGTPIGKAKSEISELKQEVFFLANGYDDVGRAVELFGRKAGVTYDMEKEYEKWARKLEEVKKKVEEARREEQRWELAKQRFVRLGTTDAERIKEEFDMLKKMYEGKEISEKTYTSNLRRLAGQKEGIGTGQVGFLTFAQQVQDLMLKKDDPAAQTVEELKHQTEVQKEIRGELQKFNLREPIARLS